MLPGVNDNDVSICHCVSRNCKEFHNVVRATRTKPEDRACDSSFSVCHS